MKWVTADKCLKLMWTICKINQYCKSPCFIFVLDGPRKVLQASPVSSNYSPGLGTLSQNNLLDHFLLWRQIETPMAMTHVFSQAHGLEVLAGAGEICWKTRGKSSLVTHGLGTDPTHVVPVAQELPLNLSWVSKWQRVRKLKGIMTAYGCCYLVLENRGPF